MMSNISVLHELLNKCNNDYSYSYSYSKRDKDIQNCDISCDKIVCVNSIKILNVKYASEYNILIDKKMICVKFNLKDDLGLWCLNVNYDKYKDIIMKFTI